MIENRIGYINSAKGILSMIIVLHHYACDFTVPIVGTGLIEKITFWLVDMMDIMYKFGGCAVDFFFFLSGYLCFFRGGVEETSLSQYVGKKLFRIYPLLFVNTFLSVISRDYSIMHILRNVLLIHVGIFTDSNQSDSYLYEVGGATWFLGPLFISYILFFVITKYCKHDFRILLYTFLALFGMVEMQAVW